MLFNSFEFIFFFLPIVAIVFYILSQRQWIEAAKIWLVFSSLFFYSWWNVSYLPLILLSILVNYLIGQILMHSQAGNKRKQILTGGIVFNILLLGYFKYADFFIENMNLVLVNNLPLLHLALPLAISFFTFQQIAYLVDSYRYETKEMNFWNYCLFVTFFPQLIAGPIVHHKEVMPQFAERTTYHINYTNMAVGAFLFSIGLFKKVILADSFAIWATEGFDELETVSFLEAWIVSLSYTFQLYFDFSGYMDMAMGAALFFNIKLPINFYSPYKQTNIQEVWNCWHITLNRFLYKYIYAPLNRFLLKRLFSPFGIKKWVNTRIAVATMLLFLISGLWHGAGWTFLFWGFLQGAATVTQRQWKRLGGKMPKVLSWFLTFNFINFSMIFFRAEDFDAAIKMLKGMIGMSGILFPAFSEGLLSFVHADLVIFSETPLTNDVDAVKYLLIGFFIILCLKNSVQLRDSFKPTWYTLLFTLGLFIYAILNLTNVTEFLYFNF